MTEIHNPEDNQRKGQINWRRSQQYDSAEISSSNAFLLLNRYRSALMGFAALWIYIFHEWQTVFNRFEELYCIEFFIKRIGFCGVDIFLFLSGIGLTYSIENTKSIGSFYYKRIKRIVFPFIVVAVLNYCFDGWSSVQFWQNILCISFYRIEIYSFLWFVPAILTLYLFFPLYYRLFAKSSGKIRFVLCALIVWLICTLFVRNTMRYDLFGFTNRIPIFILGILAGWLAQRSNLVFDRLTWRLMGLIFLLGLYLSYLCIYQGMYILVPEPDCCIPNILMAVSISFLFVRLLFTLNEKKHCGLFGKWVTRIFSFFGMFTLEFYCVQEWAASKILPRISARYSNRIVNIILFASITMIALTLHYMSRFFWTLLERTAHKLQTIIKEKQKSIDFSIQKYNNCYQKNANSKLRKEGNTNGEEKY